MTRTKKVVRWLITWVLWVLVIFMIGVIIEPAIISGYEGHYQQVVAERAELNRQVEALETIFDSVYRMRNAEVINGESTQVILKGENITLELTFGPERKNVIKMEENTVINSANVMIGVVALATILYVAYSIGEAVGTCNKKKGRKSS